MLYRRFTLVFLVLILIFLFIFPGVILAEGAQTGSGAIENAFTLTIEAPEQAEAGQTLTVVVQVRENLYDEPVAGAKVNFFVKSDFFITGLSAIGDAVTDENGTAKFDYVPNQSGVLQIFASYDAGSDFEPVESEGTVDITGSSKSLYQTVVGIQYPNSFAIWMIAIVIIMFAIWGTFLFVLYQVQNISRGTGARGASFILIVGLVVVFTVLIMVLVTPESQYNFNGFNFTFLP